MTEDAVIENAVRVGFQVVGATLVFVRVHAGVGCGISGGKAQSNQTLEGICQGVRDVMREAQGNFNIGGKTTQIDVFVRLNI